AGARRERPGASVRQATGQRQASADAQRRAWRPARHPRRRVRPVNGSSAQVQAPERAATGLIGNVVDAFAYCTPDGGRIRLTYDDGRVREVRAASNWTLDVEAVAR